MDQKLIVKEGYKIIGEEYHEGRISRESIVNPWLSEQVALIEHTGKVLDIGCGGGRPISKFFSDNGYDVYGIDISEKMIGLAKESVPKGIFLVQDMDSMDFPSNSFVAIACFFSIIHLPRESHKAILKKMYAFLKKGGILLITMGIDDNPKQYNENWRGAPMFWSHFDQVTNRRLLENVGFKIEREEEVGKSGDTHVFFRARKP